MKKIFILSILVLQVFLSMAARDPRFQKFGKVTSQDFEPTFMENLGYDAVILLNEKFMCFDQLGGQLMLHNVYHQRIKVLRDGFSDKDLFTVHFSGRYGYERLASVKCWIFSQQGSKIVRNKLKYKSFKTTERDSLDSRMEILMPDLKAGDIIDLEYVIATFDFMLPPLWKCNLRYPCVSSLLVTQFPHFMKYKYDLCGSDTIGIYHSHDEEFISITYNYSPHDNPNSMGYLTGRSRHLTIPYKFRADVDSFKVFNTLPNSSLSSDPNNYRQTLYGTHSVRMKAAKFTQNIGYGGIYYTAWQQFTHLLYTYADPDNRYISQNEAWHHFYHSGFVIVDYMNWTRLHKRLWKSPDFWKPLLKSVYLPKELDNLRDVDEDVDVLRALDETRKYFMAHLRWDSTFSNHILRNPEQIIKSGTGNSAELNMAMVSVLRKLGVDAFPALAATRDFGDVDTSYANVIQFNTVMACVRLNEFAPDGREVFLLIDATSNLPVPQLPERDLNLICWAVPADPGPFLEILEHTNDTYNAKKISNSN